MTRSECVSLRALQRIVARAVSLQEIQNSLVGRCCSNRRTPFASSTAAHTGSMLGSLASSRSSALLAAPSAPLRAGDARVPSNSIDCVLWAVGLNPGRQLCCRPRVRASSGVQGDNAPGARAEAPLPHSQEGWCSLWLWWQQWGLSSIPDRDLAVARCQEQRSLCFHASDTLWGLAGASRQAWVTNSIGALLPGGHPII